MSFVFDADIISVFAKIGRLALLPVVFGNNLFMPEAVYHDLLRAQRAGYDYVSETLRIIKVTKADKSYASSLIKSKKLGAGEIECIALCKERTMTFVSNDEKAKLAAQTLGIDIIDLAAILWCLKDEHVVQKDELRKIINDIEVKDNTVLIGKEELLGD
ncbi:MAG TPA: hypothetical protein VJK72_02755 [Candidatus Nanoarchaeia archaeon]|nr:hypothetical protein [Candidatus Nanoarchaeia archaeon]